MTIEETFWTAVREGDAEQAEACLDERPELANADHPSGASALKTAAYQGHPKLAALLARRGAELDFFDAVILGDGGRVEEFLEGDPGLVDEHSPQGFTALGLAAFFGHRDLLKLLLERGSKVDVPARNPMRVRPLHSAVAHDDEDAAFAMSRRLLEEGADVNAVQESGFTPIHQAAYRGSARLTELLLEHGADVTPTTDEGLTPAEMAADRGYPDVAGMIEGHHPAQGRSDG